MDASNCRTLCGIFFPFLLCALFCNALPPIFVGIKKRQVGEKKRERKTRLRKFEVKGKLFVFALSLCDFANKEKYEKVLGDLQVSFSKSHFFKRCLPQRSSPSVIELCRCSPRLPHLRKGIKNRRKGAHLFTQCTEFPHTFHNGLIFLQGESLSLLRPVGGASLLVGQGVIVVLE